jgi:hypothetical protein
MTNVIILTFLVKILSSVIVLGVLTCLYWLNSDEDEK